MATDPETSAKVVRFGNATLLTIEMRERVCIVRFIEPMLRDADRLENVKRTCVRLAKEHHDFVINMSAVKYCSSLLLGSLVLMRNKVHALGGRVHICGITGPVAQLFTMSRMDSLFKQFETEVEAVADLTAEQVSSPRKYDPSDQQ